MAPSHLRFHILSCSCVLIILSGLLLSSCAGDAGHVFPGSIDPIDGSVQLRIARHPNWRSISELTYLDEGDEIRTGPNSRAVLFFNDGSRMLVGPLSHVTLMAYTQRNDFRFARLWVANGIVVYHVSPHAGNRSAFQMLSSAAAVTVRGTGGALEINADNGVFMHALLEGEAGDVVVSLVSSHGGAVIEQAPDTTIVIPLPRVPPGDASSAAQAASLLGIAGHACIGFERGDASCLSGGVAETIEELVVDQPHRSVVLDSFINWDWALAPDPETGAMTIHRRDATRQPQWNWDGITDDQIGEAIVDGLGPAMVLQRDMVRFIDATTRETSDNSDSDADVLWYELEGEYDAQAFFTSAESPEETLHMLTSIVPSTVKPTGRITSTPRIDPILSPTPVP